VLDLPDVPGPASSLNLFDFAGGKVIIGLDPQPGGARFGGAGELAAPAGLGPIYR
jgi:hypothetical protein